jgi:hypothetical protein
MVRPWFAHWSRRETSTPGSTRPRRRSRLRRQPGIEPLEDRTLLTSFQSLATGLDARLQTIEAPLNAALDAADGIPFLNGAPGLLDAKAFIESFRSSLTSALDGFHDTDASSAVQSALFDLLGTKLGLVSSPGDIQATVSGGGTSNSFIAIDIHLHKDLAAISTPVTFGLGLPALPFKLTTVGGVAVEMGFDAELAFGFDAAHGGFFFDTSKVLNLPAGQDPFGVSGHEMAVEVDANLVNFNASLFAGFLAGMATDAGTPNDPNPLNHTALAAAFTIDNLSGPPAVNVLGRADVNLALDLAFTDSTGQPSDQFPSIGADLVLDWSVDTAHPQNEAPPSVGFHHVTLNLGQLFGASSMVAQVIQYEQTWTKPIQPLIDVLNAPLPVLSDLAGQPVTLKSIAVNLAQAGAFGALDSLVELGATLADVVNQVNQIQTGGDKVTLDLGNFDLGGSREDLRTLPAATDISALTGSFKDVTSLTSWSPNPGDAATQAQVVANLQGQLNRFKQNDPTLGGVVTAAQNLLPRADGSVELALPILDDPANGLFNLLLGKDADLVSFTAKFAWDDQQGNPLGTPIPGLSADFSSQLHLDGFFQAAFDTYGIREFLHNELTGAGANPLQIGDGFYLAASDFATDPVHNTHLTLSRSITASAGIGIPVFDVGLTGSVNASLKVFVTDPDSDGRLHLDELRAAPSLFSTSGDIDGALQAFVKIGVDVPLAGFVGYEQDFNIADGTVFSFGPSSSANPFNPPAVQLAVGIPDPNVQGFVVPGGVLTLNIGSRAGARLYETGVTNEVFTVSHADPLPADPAGEAVFVSAFGVTQRYAGVRLIVADGGDGNDILTIGRRISAGAQLTEGDGNDQVRYLGSGNAVITVGNGNDLLIGGSGYNQFRTGTGSSQLIGGDGSTLPTVPPPGQAQTSGGAFFVNDFQTGDGPGNNVLQGGPASNQLVAPGFGNNMLVGGNQDDTLVGGQGTTTVVVGSGHDRVRLSAGKNAVIWSAGDGNLDIEAPDNTFQNTLQVTGSPGPDTFVLSPFGSHGGVTVQANTSTINADGIFQKVSIDGADGAETITIHDLSTTGTQDVGVDDSEAQNPDGASDVINIDGTANSRVITVATENAFLHPEGPIGGVMLVQPDPHYKVHAAVVNGEDMLFVNPVASNNTINVQSNTGHTVVNRDGGNDTYNVSSDAPTDTGVLLDHPTNRVPFGLFGPLDLHAGPGLNTLTVSESGTSDPDHVVISDSRITGALDSFDPVGKHPVHLNYQINYNATGTFGGGIIFKTGTGTDAVTVTSLPAGAPTMVNTGGGGDTILVADPHQSLDALKSPLIIDGVDHNAALVLDDQGTAAAENYVIGWSPPSGNFLSRNGPPIIYRNVGTTTFDAGSSPNTIDVQAVGDSATTINAGSGTSSVGVGDAANGFVLFVGSALTIAGGSSHPTLTLNDQGNTRTSTYTLNAGEVELAGSAPVDYSCVRSLTLNGGKANNTYRVSSAGDGTPTTITGGPGNDTFNLAAAPPSHAASLLIDGGPGNDTLDLVDTQGTGLVRTIPNSSTPGSGMATVAYPGGGGTVAVSYRNVETADAVSDVTRRVKTQVIPDFGISPTSFGESLKVTNVSMQDILGNIRIVLHGLTFKTAPTRVTFGSKPLKVRFTATGDPFFSVPVGKLSAGKSLTVHLTFLKSVKVTGHVVIRVFAESLGP